jgi:hypothetical protein
MTVADAPALPRLFSTSTSRLMPAVSSWDDSMVEPYRRLAAAVHRSSRATSCG